MQNSTECLQELENNLQKLTITGFSRASNAECSWRNPSNNATQTKQQKQQQQADLVDDLNENSFYRNVKRNSQNETRADLYDDTTAATTTTTMRSTRCFTQQQQQQTREWGTGSRRTAMNDKGKIAAQQQQQQLQLLTDDLRISKLLRRLSSENSPSNAMELCHKLDTAIRSQSNIAYITRSYDSLLDNMIYMLQQAPKDCLTQASKSLGLLGYINRSDFVIYKNVLFKSYAEMPHIRRYLMQAFQTTLSYDSLNLNLSVYSERILEQLKKFLEDADETDVFIAVSLTIAEFSRHYKQQFSMHFTDIVDIVVGWHLEPDQPAELKQHCSQVLQHYNMYFLQELDFTFGLLTQFLEDLNCLSIELEDVGKSRQTKEDAELRTGCFVGAFSTILKALATHNDDFCLLFGEKTLLEDALLVISKCAKQIFSMDMFLSEHTTVNINDFLCLQFSKNLQAVDVQQVQQLIELQLKYLHLYSVLQICSLLALILCIVRQMRTQLPIGFVTLVLQTEQNPLNNIKLSLNERPYKLLLKIYRELLMLRNVPLLQEAYLHITKDMDKCMLLLQTVDVDVQSERQKVQASLIMTFLIAALSALSTQTSSIIGMYALNPSIVELLIVNCKLADTQLWQQHSTLHAALIQVLCVHCIKNNNFRRSSRLLTERSSSDTIMETNAATTENFSIILHFLANILGQATHLSVENLKVLLNWLQQLLEDCLDNADILADHVDFLSICQSLSDCAMLEPLACASCMQLIMRYNTLNMPILTKYRDVARLQMNSNKTQLAHAYAIVQASLPLAVSLQNRSTQNNQLLQQHTNTLMEAQHWYKSTSHYSALRALYFKPFLEHLQLQTANRVHDSVDNAAVSQLQRLYADYFTKCWQAQTSQAAMQFQSCIKAHNSVLLTWLQHEVARYCINNKLRTSIGKPQETFFAIETILLKYARMLSNSSKNAEESFESGAYKIGLPEMLQMQQKAKILLGFLESLEKQIYNAAEGTAFALLAAEKPAKNFFRLNANTCNEWFKRIRTAVNLVALHCMEPELVIRNAECMLKNHMTLDTAQLDQIVVSLASALLCCKETATLAGLQQWLKQKYGKRYQWILCAVEQSAGHKELAAQMYTNTLQENNDTYSNNVKEFILNQLMYCHYNTAAWTQLRQLQHSHATLLEENVAFMTNLRTESHLQLMQMLHEQEEANANNDFNETLLNLCDWSELEQQRKPNYSIYNLMHQMEDGCMLQALKQQPNAAKLQAAVYEIMCQSLQHGCLVKCNPQQHDLIIINHVAHKLSADNHNTDALDCSQTVQDSTLLLKCLNWKLLFERLTQKQNKIAHTLYLDVAVCARQEQNLKLSGNMLQRFFALKNHAEPLSQISQKIQNKSYHCNVTDATELRAIYELSKCIYAGSNVQQLEAINLGAAFCLQLKQQVLTDNGLDYNGQMLLTLADWLTQRGNNANMPNTNLLTQLLQTLPEFNNAQVMCAEGEATALMPELERSIGKLLHASVLQQHSHSAEAWCAFGNWCYRWGKRLAEKQNANDEKLASSELNAIRQLLGDNIDESELQQLLAVLEQQHNLAANGDGLEEIDNADYNSYTENIEQELKKLSFLQDKSAMQITRVVELWRQAQKGTCVYYEMAAKAYFKYLAIENADGDLSFVTITLRLLRLVIKYSLGLQEVLEEGLRLTPLRPWKSIIPQVFSRLNHHEPYVRKSLSDLLCRLAKDRPNLIIFPAVVGAQQELQLQSCSSELTNSNNPTTQIALSNGFGALLATLSKQAPQTVQHVQLLVKELKRITLLWEEFWIHALAQLYNEYSTLMTPLEVELKKATDVNQMDSIKTKYELITQHLTNDLQKIAALSEKPAETNYERLFQQRYSTLIRNTIAELQNHMKLNNRKLTEGLSKIKQLYAVMQQRSMRIGSSSTMKLSDLSPILANMQNSTISMPGVDTFEKASVHIKSVDSTIYILPTKTKPKKLAFLGSDGRKYTYLFKGLEDLHLDERIMQFLSISNSMMARSNEPSCFKSNFKAHYYSVIPLGPQSGLISWVDGVTPLFAIYKKWQQRDAALKQQQKERQNSAQSNPNTTDGAALLPAGTRPTELFYNKLTPLLAEQNIKVTDSRKQWPLPILKRVLEELTNETPKDLLCKELWCQSINAADWRKTVRNYAASLAVMSAIGYVIGLGDRHLDNVLIKLSTGEILHIDYNVCFEKGKTLRVPEKVPFRMTPNFEEALGITGIEGAFRLGCEYVLKTLRKERETLLTLLEAFVYDPLVDWTTNDGCANTTAAARITSVHAAAQAIANLNNSRASAVVASCSGANGNGNAGNGSNKSIKSTLTELVPKKIEYEQIRQSIESKFTKIKENWLKQQEDLETKVLTVVQTIAHIQQNRELIKQAEQEQNNITKQLNMVREVQTLGSAMTSHSLNTISQRYAVYRENAKVFNESKLQLEQCHDDLQSLLKTYFEQIIGYPAVGNKLLQLQLELCTQRQNEQQNMLEDDEFQLVHDFLLNTTSHNATLYEQCDFARKEMDNTLFQLSNAALQSLEFLLQYSKVMQFYPRSQLQRKPLMRHKLWYEQMLHNQYNIATLEKEIKLRNSVAECYTVQQRKKAMDYVLAMEKLGIDLNFELHKCSNELNEQKQVMLLPVEMAIADIQNFITVGEHVHLLQTEVLQLLMTANNAFATYERQVFQESNTCHMLELQLEYIDNVQQMCLVTFGTDIVLTTSTHLCLQKLSCVFQTISKLKSAYECNYLDQLVHIFMQDNEPQLSTLLQSMCQDSVSYHELLQCQQQSTNDKFLMLLHGMLTHFEELEQVLLDLQTDNATFHQILNARCGNVTAYVRNLTCQTISSFFRAVRNAVKGMLSNDIAHLYDIHAIYAPITSMLQQLQSKLLCELITQQTAQLFEYLSQTTSATVTATSQAIDDADLQHCKTLAQNLYIAFQRKTLLNELQLQEIRATKIVEHHTLIASAHFWLHEPLLQDAQSIYTHIVYKCKLLSSIAAHAQTLTIWKETLLKVQSDWQKLIASVLQQLEVENAKANQQQIELITLLETFVAKVNAQRLRNMYYIQLATELLNYSQIVLQLEQQTSVNDNSNSNSEELSEIDQQFLQRIKQWHAAFMNFRQSANQMMSVEQDIVQLLDPEGEIDHYWLKNVTGLLDEMFYAVQDKLSNQLIINEALEQSLNSGAQQLQQLLDVSVRMDVKQLLKLISKNCKPQKSLNASTELDSIIMSRIKELTRTMKLFQTNLSEILQKLASHEHAEAALKQISVSANELLILGKQNYSDFLLLLQRFVLRDKLGMRSDSPKRSDDSPMHVPDCSNNDKKGANQLEQKRNAYAVSVWKRIRMKLEGRDPDANRRSSVAEQVDYIIREAMNADNLAVLYEGWTPWV